MGKVGSLKKLAVGGVVLTALIGVALVASSLAGAAHVEPVPGPDNAQESDCPAGSVGWKYQPVATANDVGDGVLSVDVTVNDTDAGPTFDFSGSNRPIVTVFVKGGPVSNKYVYDPAVTSDTGLHAPVNPNNEKYFGLSHLVFCYTPPPATGSLTVIKEVDNDDGDAESGDWTMNVAGPTQLSFPGTGAPGTTNEVDVGSYTVTESGGPSGYTLAYSGDCDANGNVTIADGDEKTCILTNSEDEGPPPPPENGSITVQKQTIPDGYQPPQGGFDFTGAIEAVLNDDETATEDVEPGTYTVTEDLTGRPFWDLISIECSDDDSSGDLPSLTATFEVDPGEDVTCVFTNQKRSLLIVEKTTNPEGAGGDQAFPFETSYGDFSLTEGGENATPLPAGSYSVDEVVPDGWELESASCDNGDDPREGPIELPADTAVRCTFVNAPVEESDTGTIIVEKETVPSGDETEFEFTLGEAEFTLADGEQEIFEDLDAGDYSVVENTPEGWDLTSAVCESDGDQGPIDPGQIELSEGETVTCTFTNTKLGTIIVEKQTSPNGASGSFTFTGDAAGTIGDGGQIVESNLEPGTYTSTESAAAGWLLGEISCDDEESGGNLQTRTATFELDPGETITCVFTNAQQTVGKGSISVSKSVSPTSLKEPGGSASYSVTITNTSNVNVTVTSIVDDRFGSLENVTGGNPALCFDVPINLSPGGSSNCSFSKTLTGVAGTSHVNTVTASGIDAFGNPVTASDDARVDFTPKLIDLVIVKNASSPTPLNGNVNYSLAVTNNGPDTATDVQLADPAPAGITYKTATPSQGSCAVGPALVTCNLGTITPGQTVSVAITATATAVGTHVNTATVTGSGGRETNPADNTDSAQTVVPAPLTPPTPEPKPPVVVSDVCLSLTVTPKMIKADGTPDHVTARVRAASKPMKGMKVRIRGKGIEKSGRTNAKGVVVITINPKKPGLLTVTTISRRDSCGARRIGVVGVFLPPLTG